MFILPHGTWKDNIRSVILDWKKRPGGHSSRSLRSSCVFSNSRTISQKDSLPQKKDMRELSYYIQSSPSKNNNMNYIFINLRVTSLFVQRCNILYLVNKVLWMSSCRFVEILVEFSAFGLILVEFSVKLTFSRILGFCCSVKFKWIFD